MALARHRLDLLLLPAEPDTGRAAIEAAWDGLRAAGVIPVGGGGRVRLDVHDTVRFWANRTGGFRVACPDQRVPIVAAFVRALEAWRVGGPRVLACPACGDAHPLEALAFAPDAGFARGAVCLEQVEHAEVPRGVHDALVDAWGGVRVVARRG